MRSLSFDTLHTASHGLVVTENWLEFGERLRTLKCLHDKNDNLVREISSLLNIEQLTWESVCCALEIFYHSVVNCEP